MCGFILMVSAEWPGLHGGLEGRLPAVPDRTPDLWLYAVLKACSQDQRLCSWAAVGPSSSLEPCVIWNLGEGNGTMILFWSRLFREFYCHQARGEVLALLDTAEAGSRDNGAAPPGSLYVSASWLACVITCCTATPIAVLLPSEVIL